MQLARPNLTVLLNALYDTGTDEIPVRHPADEVGELARVHLGDPLDSEVEITLSKDEYADTRSTVDREYGSPAVDELPEPRSYVSAFVAGGLLDTQNRDTVQEFLDRNGNPDLNAGHRPVVAGFDTNLLPWRPVDVLGLESGSDAVVNGFALATGVRDELDWDHKRGNTKPLERAFGAEFAELWNQPAGARREGRLGEINYRRLRDHRYAEEVVTDTGDESIVDGYDAFQQDGQKDVLLFSNDRDFVERARAHRVRSQRVELPTELPGSLTGSWDAIRDTLYVLAVLFGVLELPKVTLYGVWRGKDGMAWHDEALKLDCRSPKLEPLIERDVTIIDAY